MEHELSHVLNMNTGTLSPLNTTSIPNSSFGLITIPNGPLAGTTVPWTTIGGGHAFLKPSPTAVPAGTIPAGYSDPRLNSPSGDLVTNAALFFGAHRKLVSDLDAVVIASVSNFDRVNLTSETYVALPDFAGTTTPAPEQGTMSSLLTLNGSAALAQNTTNTGATVTSLRLTPDAKSQAGSAFLTKPFQLTAGSSFESEFGFKIGGVNGDGPLGSDGLAFVVQSDPRGANAIGNGGEGLGYGNNPTFGNAVSPISPSLAVEFDTHGNSYDINGNHVGVVLNGDVAHAVAQVSPTFTLNDGLEHFAWVDYDFQREMLSIFLGNTDVKPDDPVLTELLDLSNLLGSDDYFGFTAGTGDGFNYHDVLEWNLDVAVPEPSSLVLFVSAFLGLGLLRRQSSKAA
jgi:hypothetical protein